jgi:type VI secretion system secreted protein VgrG
VVRKEDQIVSLSKLLGIPMTVNLEVADGEKRHFHGFITEAEVIENTGASVVYALTISPWVALLQNTSNCKIFQKMSVPEIIKQVFRDRGFSDFEDALTGEYAKNEYVVQYRESDFNFVSRLMEQEGIYYFHKQSPNKHVLVLADSRSAHKPGQGCAQLPYIPTDGHRTRFKQYVERWRTVQRITPGKAVLRDYDFEKPNVDLTAKRSSPKNHARADYEVFDYPGKYTDRNVGEERVRTRLEQEQEPAQRIHARTNAGGLGTGNLLKVSNHPLGEHNTEYLVVASEVTVVGSAPRSGQGTEESSYFSDFTAMDSKLPYRTPATTRKPIVEGPQTAVVVGKAGEEIWTDKYGRVKVQFHWDRVGEKDENSSCWVRVSQVWAGNSFGAIFTPRVGQEVIVSFLEGDPDRPIITGRVYNASNMPPYALPANQTQSGFKTRSSKGGSVMNANELRFEDKKGAEEVFLQAERDLNVEVKNEETRKVAKNRTTTIGGDDQLTVDGNLDATIKQNATVSVGKKLVLEAGTEIELKTGASSITMNSAGEITIRGMQIKILGSGAVSVQAGGVLVLKGSVVTGNG